MKISPYQKAILEAVKDGTDNLIVEAVAGSGKTTTLKLICDILPKRKKVVAVCFNKKIAEQFREKLPGHVDSTTMHAMGLRIIVENFGRVKIDQNKKSRILTRLWGRPSDRSYEESEICDSVRSVGEMCLNTMTDPLNPAAMEEMLDTYGLDIDGYLYTKIVEGICVVQQACREDRQNISFDDMLDFPVHFGLHGQDKYDVILGDEVQDWNKLQAAFMRLVATREVPTSQSSMLDSPHCALTALDELCMADGGLTFQAQQAKKKPRSQSRLVLVGDSRQSIYAFRGADVLSMPTLKADFACRELPLSVCYRCPKAVVRAAQAIVGEDTIQWCDTAEEGEIIRSAPHEEADLLMSLPDGALVMCRCNAPLVSGVLYMLQRGRKATLQGRDFGKTLTKLVNIVADRERATTIPEFRESLRSWADREIDQFLKDERFTAAQLVEDKYNCLMALCENSSSVRDLIQYITKIFEDTPGDGVVFSTGHRAKGLEADVAVIWDPCLIPHPMAMKSPNPDAAMSQEMNLLYVMVTRAMKTLIYHDSAAGCRRSSFPSIQDIYDSTPDTARMLPMPHEHRILGVDEDAARRKQRRTQQKLANAEVKTPLFPDF